MAGWALVYLYKRTIVSHRHIGREKPRWEYRAQTTLGWITTVPKYANDHVNLPGSRRDRRILLRGPGDIALPIPRAGSSRLESSGRKQAPVLEMASIRMALSASSSHC